MLLDLNAGTFVGLEGINTNVLLLVAPHLADLSQLNCSEKNKKKHHL